MLRLERELNVTKTQLAQVRRLAKLAPVDLPRPSLTDVGWKRVKGIQEPEYNPVRLWAYFELDDTLQGVNTKIATEATRKGWEIIPRFAKRCADCGVEYQGAVDECESCGNVAFVEPNPAGKKMLEDFFRNLNADVPTDAILEDTALFSGVLDNWFWWVRSAPNPLNPDASIPIRVDVLDARFVRAMTDADGRFESGEWFCPTCYWTSERREQTVKKGDAYAGVPCPAVCGGLMQETAWVQRNRTGKIVGRWTAGEIVHGKRFGGSFRLYGLSKVVSLAIMIEALLYQGKYLVSAYRDRRTWDGILTVPLGKEDGKQMMKEAYETWSPDPSEPSVLTLFTGGDGTVPPGEAKWLNMMGRFSDLAPLDFRREYRKAMMSAYGVGEVVTGAQTAGQLGHPADALEASYDSIEGVQTHLEDTVDRGVVSRFPPAASKDWKWQLVSPKQRDEKLDWDVRRAKVEVARAVNDANMDVHATIDAEWEVTIEEGPPPQPAAMPGWPGEPTIPGMPITSPPTPPGEVPAGLFPDEEELGAKELSPRDLPRSAAVPGIRGIEDAYASDVIALYERAIEAAVRDAGGSVDASVWNEAVNRRFAAARSEAIAVTESMAAKAYVAALLEEADAIPQARFEQVDEAVIERIASPDAFLPAFEGFDREARDAVVGVISRRFAEPAGLDLKAMVEEMREATGAAVFRLERIARSETTRIVNEARAAQWRKYADVSRQEFEWVIARDERVDERCKEIAARNPWNLEELYLETNGFLVHANCRCMAVRRPSLSLR